MYNSDQDLHAPLQKNEFKKFRGHTAIDHTRMSTNLQSILEQRCNQDLY